MREELWLTREVLPVLSEVQEPADLPPAQLAAALAYLEATWSHASRLAAKTDRPGHSSHRSVRSRASRCSCRRGATTRPCGCCARGSAGACVRGSPRPPISCGHPRAHTRERAWSRSHTLAPAMAPAFDLQSHSTHSDGALEAAAVVRAPRGRASSCSRSAITTRSRGCPRHWMPANAMACGWCPRSRSPRSTTCRETPRELHILGYLVDHSDPAFQATLANFLPTASSARCGWPQPARARLRARRPRPSPRAWGGQPIGRPHLAEAALSAPANAAAPARGEDRRHRLVHQGYLIEGKPAFRMREKPTVKEAIEAIHAAGGVAIWAHPSGTWPIATRCSR